MLPGRSNTDRYPARLDGRQWLFLLSASLLTGLIFAFASSTGSFAVGRKSPIPPIEWVQRSGEAQARIGAKLRSYLDPGLPNPPDDYLQDVRVSSVAGELPLVGDEMRAPASCLETFKTNKSYQIVRAQISPETPTFIKMQLFENLSKALSLYGDRPSFLVFELSTRESFGAFSIESSENYIYCLLDSEGERDHLLVDLNGSLYVPGSINEAIILLLGDLRTYSQLEKIPIWLH